MTRWSESEWTEGSLIGGHPAVDFVNTAGGRTKARDLERLREYDDLVRWSLCSKLVSEGEAQSLLRNASVESEAAAHVLLRSQTFREALHTGLMHEQRGDAFPEDVAGALDSVLRTVLSRAALRKTSTVFVWSVGMDALGIELPLARIVLSAEELLRSADLAKLRNCDRCSWLFIDRSRGRPRRWCSMTACGGREKSQRHYRRRTGREDS